MIATDVLDLLSHFLDDYYGRMLDNSHSPQFTPNRVGAFGSHLTDCYTLPVKINGEKFYISVEKDPNQ